MSISIESGDWVKFRDRWAIVRIDKVYDDMFTVEMDDGRDTFPTYSISDIEHVIDSQSMRSPVKTLIKKFSYNSLLSLCKEKGWRLPTLEDLEGENVEYETIWIDKEPDKKDRETHASVLTDGKVKIANKNFMYNCLVVREGEAIVNALNKYKNQKEQQ